MSQISGQSGAVESSSTESTEFNLNSNSTDSNSVQSSPCLSQQNHGGISANDVGELRVSVNDGPRSVFEVGSSSGSRQPEETVSNNLPVEYHLNDSSFHTSLMMPSWNLYQGNNGGPRSTFEVGSSSNSRQPENSLSNHLLPVQVHSNYHTSSMMPFWNLSQGNFQEYPLLRNNNNNADVHLTQGGFNPMVLTPFSAATPRPSVSHRPEYPSLAMGIYCGINGGGYNHQQMEHNQWPTVPYVPPSTNQQLQPGFLSPWNGPYPHPATSGLGGPLSPQHGHNCLIGHNPYVSGPLVVPHTSQGMEAQVGRDHWTIIPEPPNPFDLLRYLQPQPIPHELQMYVDPQSLPQHVQMHLQAQATIATPTFWFPEAVFLQDMHRDLRLDVDNMSYEELLALGEEIGNVGTGLNEETITKFLKRKVYGCDVENPISEAETCCVCREDYVEGEDIGELNCRHEFHADCIEQWLIVKNTCPICQVKGLDPDV